MKQTFLITIAALLSCYGFSQNRAINWAFGDSAGLNFATEPPLPFLSSILMYEPCASISDETGNLLFYTNGKTLWNAEHEIMMNGNFLDNGVGTLSSNTQGVIILPDPGDTNKYYVFHKDFNFLKYTIVNMSLEDGLGLVTSKNNIISDIPFTEKLQAVRHANGRDWWLLIETIKEVDALNDSTNFYSLLITPAGISEPFLLEGTILPDQETFISIGQMKFNQQGTMLACTNGRSVNIYNFDRCSGYLSHLYTIDSIFVGNNGDLVYGLEFSSPSNKLYITKEGAVGKTYLYQFTLDSIENIKDTKKIIYLNSDTGIYIKYLHQLQLAVNNKIYVALTSPYNPTIQLCVINNPNASGMACNFDTLTVNTGGRTIELGLPNMPNYNLGVMEKSGCDTIGTTAINNITNNTIQLYPNPAHSYVYMKQAPQGIVQIHVTDIYGKEVLYVNQNGADIINISSLSSGLYFITITQENEMLITQKLVVER